MPNRLTNLVVDTVSLVDRAAVRDPSDPSQPQRFLLAKADVPPLRPGRKLPAPLWHQRPNPSKAASFLSLDGDQSPRVLAALQHAKTTYGRADDILRAAGVQPLPASDPAVQRIAHKARMGKPLWPVLLVRSRSGRSVIADGLHKLSYAWHRDPRSAVAVVEAPTKRTTGAKMAKTKTASVAKQEKTLTELAKLAKRDDLSPGTRESVRKSQQELQLAYLERVSPAGAAAWRAAHPDF